MKNRQVIQETLILGLFHLSKSRPGVYERVQKWNAIINFPQDTWYVQQDIPLYNQDLVAVWKMWDGIILKCP